MDTVSIFLERVKRYIFTAIDVKTRFAFAHAYKTNSSANGQDFLNNFTCAAPFTISHIQTDNCSEFLKCFNQSCQDNDLVHFFNYPRHPQSNGHLERFNRTMQEQFADWHTGSLDDPAVFNKHLTEYLIWHNTAKPHRGIGKAPPLRYYLKNFTLHQSNMLWTRLDAYKTLPLKGVFAILSEVLFRTPFEAWRFNMSVAVPARAPLLADVVWPRAWGQTRTARLVKDIALMVGFAGFVALTAQIALKLPWTTVPITMQTFGVLVSGGALGAWRGAGSMLIYMAMGMIGIPVFAPNLSMSGGWGGHFIGPWQGTASLPWDISSGGYIVGFILAAFVAGYFAQKAWDRKPWGLVSMLAGNILVYVPGLLWLGFLIGSGWVHPVAHKPLADLIAGSSTLDKTMKGGLYPFLVGDFMKIYLASLLLPAAWVLVEKVRGKQNSNKA